LLTKIQADELPDEIGGSISDLEAMGLKRPQFFAYPYGELDSRIRQAAEEAGAKAAFTVDLGLVRPGQDPLALPRVEILRSDTGWKFWRKIILAGSQ
jgi:hypothetical protein